MAIPGQRSWALRKEPRQWGAESEMRDPIEFYFDFSSPYGYFGASLIEPLAARFQRQVIWRPVLLGAIFKVTGGAPIPTLPLKGRYGLHDFERSARYYGVPFTLPKQFPISAVAASRAFYWVEACVPAKAKDVARALFHAYFVQGLDISKPEVVVDVVAGQGPELQGIAQGMQEQAVKDRLKNETAKAIERGVCGSPVIIVDGELFWGADRLVHVEKWLETGGF